MKALFKMSVDCNDNKYINGVFIADTEMVEKLIDSKTLIHFDDILGKNTEAVAYIDPGEIKFITSNDYIVQIIEENNLEKGFNPFDFKPYNVDLSAFEDKEVKLYDYIKTLIK